MESIKVSIIMPSLNVVDYIEECLLSALGQTLQEIEIICIDAKSTDGTYEILKTYAERLEYRDKIRLLESDIRSYGYQVNLGIKEARGKYIAILETDDFVSKEMYAELYRLGEFYKADFVKADFDIFYELDNKNRLYEKVSLWAEEKQYYNKVLKPNKEAYLYAYDSGIWKGIYNRKFLFENEIWCNESKGAAFQDIGFCLQVLACAKCAYYTDKSYYRYRRGRDESSVNSVNVLKYVYQEFYQILNGDKFAEKLTYKEGIYLRMAYAFVGEYSKVIQLVSYDKMSDRIKPYYEWIREELRKVKETDGLQLEVLNESLRDDLLNILYHPDVYAQKLKKSVEREHIFYTQFINKNVYVFGAGRKGKRFVDTLLMKGITPVLVCDNNESMWGNSLSTIRVISPKESVALYKKDESKKVFVIANKYYSKDIKKQLISYGLSEFDIIKSN